MRPQNPGPSRPATLPSHPTLTYPQQLPISARRADILRELAQAPVVIVAGATGSGKTTQLPKLALELHAQLSTGRERASAKPQLVGVTQPRRIAATSVAARVAEEVGCTLGREVGYQIRFEDRSCSDTLLKFMTDGILLAELQGDPLLRRYHTLIIDEAHERSLNIDFLLGCCKQLLARRPELKLLISSATIETARFSEFFGNAPVIEVEGRTFPVDVIYEPPDPEEDPRQAVAKAVESIVELDPEGDILVFLPGEREILETERLLQGRRLKHTEVLPLFGRLSAADQNRVFHGGQRRRVILATNVAETSLTLPGIVYVVDAGVARLSRYDPRSGTTRLQIEEISQASANQRKGRSGRVRDGICVRLYEESNFESRPAFTDPEVRRVGLAGVILRMKASRLGEVETFPFLDPPPQRAIAEGYRVLEELGALDGERQLTALGRQLARFPVDPRVGRMILAGVRYHCLDEILVLAAALEIRDPRERPRGHEQQADQRHQAFRDASSDFVGLLKLWDFLNQARAESNANHRRVCKEYYISYARVREWREVHRQLSGTVRELKLRPPRQPASGEPVLEKGPGSSHKSSQSRQDKPRRRRRGGPPPRGRAAPNKSGAPQPDEPRQRSIQSEDHHRQVHMALLSGLLSRLGQYSSKHKAYVGSRQTRFSLHPSSALAKNPPAWVMAFEVVETSKLFARTTARVDPLWLDEVGSHLLKRRYSDPTWSEKSARASVREHATLYGLPVLRDRSVDYASIAPGRAHLMFLEHALVRGEYTSSGDFQAKNQQLLADIRRLRDRARKSDMLADDDELLTFFERRVPRSVVNGKTFEAWRKKAEEKEPSLLILSSGDVLTGEEVLRPEDYPDEVTIAGSSLALHYLFDPRADDDGVTLDVPIALAPRLQADLLDWTIPAWHERRIHELLLRLPKAQRRGLGALDQLSLAVAKRLRPFREPLLPSLIAAIEEHCGVTLPETSLRTDLLPPYLRLNCRILGPKGKVLGCSRDLRGLFEKFGAEARAAMASVPKAQAAHPVTCWDFGALAPSEPRRLLGAEVVVYPALVKKTDQVYLTHKESAEEAFRASVDGVHQLLALQHQAELKALAKKLPAPFPTHPGLPVSAGQQAHFRREALARIVREAHPILAEAQLPRNKHRFEELAASGKRLLGPAANSVSLALRQAASELQPTLAALHRASQQRAGATAIAEMRSQLELLYGLNLLRNADLRHFAEFPRYLKALRLRLERAQNNPQKDGAKLAPFTPVWEDFLTKYPRYGDQESAHALRWAFEELRVTLFAPELKPAYRVGVDSLRLALSELELLPT